MDIYNVTHLIDKIVFSIHPFLYLFLFSWYDVNKHFPKRWIFLHGIIALLMLRPGV